MQQARVPDTSERSSNPAPAVGLQKGQDAFYAAYGGGYDGIPLNGTSTASDRNGERFWSTFLVLLTRLCPPF